jgi:predicted phosphodiesterase
MRVLILSDIHANLVALEAVLAAAAGRYDSAWCLGDLVGYGPDPNECVAAVRALPGLICLVGNHDKAVIGDVDLNVFNGDARAALAWTQDVLTPESADYLAALPARTETAGYTLAHGSPRQPVWEYILDRFVAQDNFAHFATPVCLVGHTHLPVIYRQSGPYGEAHEEAPNYEQSLALDGDKLILNPGSVGQPRDSNPAAAYALLDVAAGAWQYCRAAYDIHATQSRMRAARLPERLAGRLGFGW